MESLSMSFQDGRKVEGNLVRGYQLEIWKILIRLGKRGGG